MTTMTTAGAARTGLHRLWPRGLRHQVLLLLAGVTAATMVLLHGVTAARMEDTATAATVRWAEALARESEIGRAHV